MPNAPLNDFLRNLKAVEFTRKRSETLYAENKIVTRDLHSVYEALFLRAVTSFEAFLESLFLSILHEKTQYSKTRVALRMKVSSKEALMEILLQGDKYMDWLPFTRTEGRARLYLKDGRPFTDVNDGDRSVIKTIHTIRNAIAHKSEHAVSEFRRTVIQNLILLPRERNPAGFLRSPVQAGRNRFETYMIELGRIATVLS